jgi:hypothetical protein
MSVADCFILDRAQAETLLSIVSRLLQPAVVEGEPFRLAIFKKKFPVVGALEPAADQLGDLGLVEPGAVGKRGNIRVHWL